MKSKSLGFGTFILSLSFVLASIQGFSQSFFGKPYQHIHDEKCAATYIEHLQEERLGIYGSKDFFETWMNGQLEQRKKNAPAIARTQNGTRVIPVVVHVIHNGTAVGTGTNIPTGQIETQIRILNEDFRRLNPDRFQTPEEFLPVAGDANIEFVLAKQDPNGLPTDGIVRVQGPKSVYTPSDAPLIGQLSLWPPEDYMNIWVVPLVSPFIGYASFPISDLPGLNFPPNSRETDGVTIDYRYFGEGGNAVAGSRGRTTTHEVGHFFGLRHIWGDGGCEVDDFVTDTPNQDGSNLICRTDNPRITCNTRDMVENFMDYTADQCMNIFTKGQIERFDVVLASSPRRASLVNGRGTVAPVLRPDDLRMSKIIEPQDLVCSQTFSPQVEVFNLGTNAVTSTRVEIRNNGALLQSRDFNVALAVGETTILTFDPITINPSGNNFEARITLVNGRTDSNPSNNTLTSQPRIQPALQLPYSFRFEELNSTWEVVNPDSDFGWEQRTISIGGTATNTVYVRNYEYDSPGEQDFLISPSIDLSNVTNAQLTFNLAHAPYNDPSVGDVLLVAVSTDCGNSFEIANAPYNKNRVFLQTVTPTPDEFIPNSNTQFRREIVNLSQYAGLPNVRLAFINVNGYGNNLFIKDIEILTNEVHKYDVRLLELLSPTPINSNNYENEEIVVTNTGTLPISGFVFQRTGTSTQNFIARGNQLAPGDTTLINLPKSTASGINTLGYSVLFPNFDQNPRTPIELRRFVVVDVERIRAPFRQNFNNTVTFLPWLNINPENNLSGWSISNLQSGPLGSAVARLAIPSGENSFWLGSPLLDLTVSRQAAVFFDIAAGQVSPSTVFKVLASDNGGNDYVEVMKMTGAEITTVQAAEANPNNSNEFERKYVNLSAFAGTGKNSSRIAFVVDNGQEGFSPIYLDNVELFLSADEEPVNPGLGRTKIYPNPATDFFNIVFNFQNFESVNIQIVSATGAVVHNVDYPNTLNQTYRFSSEQFTEGLYIVKITSRSITETIKLFVQ